MLIYLASVAAAAESAHSAENIENVEINEGLTTNVNEEFVEILKSSCDIFLSAQEDCLTRKQNKEIRRIKSKIGNLYHDISTSTDTNIDNVVLLAHAHLYLFRIYAATSKNATEVSLAKAYIDRCVALVKERETERKVILLAIEVHYYLGYLYHKLNKHESSLVAFEKALQLYLAYTRDEDHLPPVNVVSAIISNVHSDPEYLLEEHCVMVLQDLFETCKRTDEKSIQVIIDKVVFHKHRLLKRLLNRAGSDYIDWASQLISLTEIFLNFQRFPEARNDLAVASFIMKKYYQEVYMETDDLKFSTEKASMFEQYKQIMANINWHWARYGLKLLQASQEKVLCGEKNKPCAMCKFQSLSVRKPEQQPVESHDDLKEDLEEFTLKITDQYLSDYANAKMVFVTVLAQLNKATEYFTPQDHLSKYVSVMRDSAYAYKYLAFYEGNNIKQAKMHRLRIQTLENILNIFHGDTDDSLLKPVFLEMAITYSDILDIETNEFRYNSFTLIEEKSNEINTLLTNISKYWQSYLNNST